MRVCKLSVYYDSFVRVRGTDRTKYREFSIIVKPVLLIGKNHDPRSNSDQSGSSMYVHTLI